MKKLLFSLSIILTLFIGCTTTKEDPFPANLLGIIFDNYNNPVSGAIISIEENITISSDIDGRFILPNLKKQTDPALYLIYDGRAFWPLRAFEDVG